MTASDDKSYFIDEAGAKAFTVSFMLLLGQLKDEIVGRYIDAENAHRFRHSGPWVHPNAPQVVGGEIQRHGATAEVPFDAVIKHDLGVIERNLHHIVEEMDRQFAQMMYATVAQACDTTGNSVDAQAHENLAEAFMEAIERLQFSASREGVVDMPQLHLSSDIHARMLAALNAAPPEFIEKMEALKARKIAEAQAREVERKAKFVGYGEGD